MNRYAEVVVLVEGATEQRFVKQVLGPYMADRRVYMTSIILSKPGQKGGDVKFARARNDIEKHLKQRRDTWITLLIDYYGIREDWPGYKASKLHTDHKRKAQIMYDDTAKEVQHLFPGQNPATHFIPYVSMHETEALYFSDPAFLADMLGVSQKKVDKILSECGEPEKINDNNQTAPSKRLEALSEQFKKTSTGIMIAAEIGIPKMRTACPLFDAWLSKLESLVRSDHGEV
jgi:hypothetical protein